MFPETMDDGMEIPQTQMDQQDQTAVQRMAEPAQMMKTAVNDLCNYQNDTDLANRAIPELIRLLTQGDVQTVQQASMTVNQLTKKEASCHSVMNNFQMVGALVRTATSSQDPDTVKSTVGAMHNMSHHRFLFLFFFFFQFSIICIVIWCKNLYGPRIDILVLKKLLINTTKNFFKKHINIICFSSFLTHLI